MPISPGQVLSERYRLIRPLGQGSQASVWVAEHLALTTHVAVKLIDPDLAQKEDARERFRHEATAAAQLRSPHVVQILDHGIDGDQPFIVMELLDGEDLYERLEKRGRISLQETSKIVIQVARALTRAHAAGIVHRDLKPENFFLTANEDDEIVKVLDFGVAKVMDPAKRTMKSTGVGTLVGTPHYMSPEQVKGVGDIDYRTDLWALGVITYQCVTGELPFDSEGVGDLLIKISIGTIPVPSKVNPKLPATFDLWFARACNRDPDLRFESARDLADALARVAGTHAEVSEAGPKPIILPRSSSPSGPPSRPQRLSPAPHSQPPTPPPVEALDDDWGEQPKAKSPPQPAQAHRAVESADLVEQPAAKRSESITELDSDLLTEDETAPPNQASSTDSAGHDVRFESEAPPPMLEEELARESAAARVPQQPPPPRIALPARPSLPQPRSAPQPKKSLPSSTVNGVASVSPPEELDAGSRRKRMTRFLLVALLALTGFVVWKVIQSQIPPDRPTVAVPPPEPTVATTENPFELTPPPSSTASAQPLEAIDPGGHSSAVAPLPPPPSASARVPRPGKPGKKDKGDEFTIEIPLPPPGP